MRPIPANLHFSRDRKIFLAENHPQNRRIKDKSTVIIKGNKHNWRTALERPNHVREVLEKHFCSSEVRTSSSRSRNQWGTSKHRVWQHIYRTWVLISWLGIFSYIWRHLDIGYVQGMCDLLAPLLVILDDGESSAGSPLPGESLYFRSIDELSPLTPVPSLPPSLLSSEAIAFSCFSELMKRMNQNFPHGGAMDTHFANMRSLIQVMQNK